MTNTSEVGLWGTTDSSISIAGMLQKIVPLLQGENLKQKEKLLEKVKEVAERNGCTMSQLALAWV